MRNTLPDRVRLGVFELDLRVGELRHRGQSVILPEQALRVMRMLVERNGELVDREEIRKTLWPNDTVVEFDHSINAAVGALRRALGDSPSESKYIQTIPRRGYRLLVPVERVDGDSPSAGASVEPKRSLGALSSGNLIGKRVSHYRVLEILGGGGMGMLYKAEDLKLGRQVALKFLPDELAADTVALQRFEREARTASSLDHPNICTIYEVEEHEEQPFIVMQLLQGETLRDRLAMLAAQQKNLPLDELLYIAVQICSGLQAAHAKGIIHRDIKPANIFLTNIGQVKILDFGLAKLVSATHEAESDGRPLGHEGTAAAAQPARSAPLDVTLTHPGVAMGTAGYMSPEQVRGEKLDARTDIFSLGLVLYEMATGQRAFGGETAAIVHDAILSKTPIPLHELNSKVPQKLEAIVNNALEKDREQRYQTAEDLRTALERARSATTAVLAKKPTQSIRRRWSLWLGISLLALVGAIAIAWAWWHWLGLRPKLVQRQLTTNPAGNRVTAAAISPDGKYLAYHDQTGLYLCNIGSGETHVVGLPGALPSGLYRTMLWFPGGKLLGDIEGKGLWVIPLSGEHQPRRLYELASDPSISPDGQRIAFIHHTFESGQERRDELWVGNVNGDAPRKLVDSNEANQLSVPAWSPDGRWIAFKRTWTTAQGSERSVIEASLASGGPRKTLLAESSLPQSNTFDWYAATWSSDWRLVFVVARSLKSGEEGSLWQVRVEPSKVEVVGQLERLAPWEDSCCWNLTTTTDAKRLAFVKYRTWVDDYLGELGPDAASMKAPRSLVRAPQPGMGGPSSWTHDGRFLLFDSMRDGQWEIFRRSPNDTIAESVITGSRGVCCVETSPDGAWFLYLEWDLTQVGENPNRTWLMRKSVSGGPAAKVLEVADVERDEFLCRYNPAANPPCVLAIVEGEDLVFYALDPIKGKGRQLGKIAGPGFSYMHGWDLSPDGSRVAVVSANEDRAKIIEFGTRIDVLTLSDGTWHRILAEPTDHTTSADDPQATWFYQIAWTADGTGFYVAAKIGDSSNLLHVTPDGKVQPLFANGSYQNQFLADLLPSPDGKYLAFEAQMYDGNAWMIDNF